MSHPISPLDPGRRFLVGLVAIGLLSSSALLGGGAGPRAASAGSAIPDEPGIATAVAAGASSPAQASRGGRTSGATLATAATDLSSAIRPAIAAPPAADAFVPSRVALGVRLVKSGFSKPVLITNAGDGSGRLFVVEQTGRIRIVSRGALLATPFIDLRSLISTGGERGLLGLAFHPSYPARPYFYVNFTDHNGNTAIDRFTVSSNRNVANRSSGVRLLTIGQPYPNHNGGNIAFGPDGFLYIGMGDGGGAGDPGNRAQNLNTLLGKMLRIDVDHTSGIRRYRSPASNPYVGRAGLDEIWSSGLRNPWRWSFDRVTHRLWIGDVGQSTWEEIDRSVPQSGFPAGRAVNFGWPVLEGRACFKPATACSTSGRQPPLAVYAHAVGGTDNCAVTGGFVYRGSAYPVLAGGYVFGDYCSGRVWVMSATSTAPAAATLVRDASASPHLLISSFGEAENGELYLCDLNGAVYRIVAYARP